MLSESTCTNPFSGPIIIDGQIPLFGGTTTSLTIKLPAITIASGAVQQLSADISISETDGSLGFSVGGTLLLFAPGTGGSATCPDGITPPSGDVCLDLSIKGALTVGSGGVSVTITGSLTGGNATSGWQLPDPVSWLTINDLTIQIGITAAPDPGLTLGARAAVLIGSTDLEFSIDLELTPEAPWVNLLGISAASENGLSMADLRAAIVAANVSGPKGSLDGTTQAYTIAANDQISSADQYKPVIIAWRNGAPVRLADVAEVTDGLENNKVGGWYRGQTAVIVNVQRQPGANVIASVEKLKAELPRLERSMPEGVKLHIVQGRTETIRASVHDVQFTLILAVVLVVLVVLLFLKSASATLIAGIGLPVSIVATFGVMWLWGFSLDNLSLMALTIAAGFVVEDAIVMVENIVRRLEEGEDPFT
ncbi:efflux RND transporter permease subunit, partial [bacterium]|nr:efflux RND transporter permease subunit [bacterium]